MPHCPKEQCKPHPLPRFSSKQEESLKFHSSSLCRKVDLAREEAPVRGFLAGTASRTSLAAGTCGTRRLRVLGRRTVAGTFSSGAGACISFELRLAQKSSERDKKKKRERHETTDGYRGVGTYGMSSEHPGQCSQWTSCRMCSSWRIACRTSRWLSGRRRTRMSGRSRLLV